VLGVGKNKRECSVEDQLILTIDVGSSSVRASLYDWTGKYVNDTEAQLPYSFKATSGDGAEIDADWLVETIARAVDGTLSLAKDKADRIAAVATSTFWHSVLGIDREGRPTTPILTWADRRAADAAAELRGRLDEGAVHCRTGCVLHSSYLPAKLLWLGRNSPEAHSSTEHWISPGEYLYRRLFGRAWVGTSMASATGLFDQNLKRWDTEVLEALPIEESQLSPISDEPARGLWGEWAKRWPMLRDVPWFPAAGDGACSNVGCGCVTRDRLALMVGTSGAMRVLWRANSVKIPPGLWCYHSDAERFVMGGALSDGGNLVAWLRKTTRLPDPEEAERVVSQMRPDSHGLTFLPLLAGERGPGWADHAHGVIVGLSMATQPSQILRAALEGVALRFALIAEILDSAILGERRVIATGGGLLGSRAWTQIMSDALGKPITVSAVEEASSRGAALLVLEAMGEIETLESVEAPLGEMFEPDFERHEVYRSALARQLKLYDAAVENNFDS
jgi:gluconokinase